MRFGRLVFVLANAVKNTVELRCCLGFLNDAAIEGERHRVEQSPSVPVVKARERRMFPLGKNVWHALDVDDTFAVKVEDGVVGLLVGKLCRLVALEGAVLLLPV